MWSQRALPHVFNTSLSFLTSSHMTRGALWRHFPVHGYATGVIGKWTSTWSSSYVETEKRQIEPGISGRRLLASYSQSARRKRDEGESFSRACMVSTHMYVGRSPIQSCVSACGAPTGFLGSYSRDQDTTKIPRVCVSAYK